MWDLKWKVVLGGRGVNVENFYKVLKNFFLFNTKAAVNSYTQD